MALIFWPGVSMLGEFPADAERVDRGVDAVDIFSICV